MTLSGLTLFTWLPFYAKGSLALCDLTSCVRTRAVGLNASQPAYPLRRGDKLSSEEELP